MRSQVSGHLWDVLSKGASRGPVSTSARGPASLFLPVVGGSPLCPPRHMTSSHVHSHLPLSGIKLINASGLTGGLSPPAPTRMVFTS